MHHSVPYDRRYPSTATCIISRPPIHSCKYHLFLRSSSRRRQKKDTIFVARRVVRINITEDNHLPVLQFIILWWCQFKQDRREMLSATIHMNWWREKERENTRQECQWFIFKPLWKKCSDFRIISDNALPISIVSLSFLFFSWAPATCCVRNKCSSAKFWRTINLSSDQSRLHNTQRNLSGPT